MPPGVVYAVNGRIERDGQQPLVDGDEVEFFLRIGGG